MKSLQSPRALTLALALALVASLLASPASAQPVTSAELWQPLQLRNDALSIGINPANLVFLNTFEAGIGVASELGESGPIHARGTFGWSPGRFIGVGAQFASAVHGPDAIVARWGLATGGEQGGIGWSVDHWYASRGSAWRNVISHRLGLSSRLSPNVGVAFVVDALNQPYTDDTRLRRSYQGALTLRSSQERIGAEIGMRAWPDYYTGALSLSLRPVDGLRVFGSVNISPTTGDLVQSASIGMELAVRHNAASVGIAHTPGQTLLSAYSSVFSTPGPQAVSRGRVLWRLDVTSRLFREHPSRTLAGREESTFVDVLLTLQRLAEPGGVAGVYLDVRDASGGPAQLWELHQALQHLRASGKTVVVYLSDASLRGLYLASAADVVVAAPTSVLLRNGIGGTRYYLAELLANIGVEAQFVRIGEYKSGPERFTNTGPSEQATEQLNAYLEDIYASFLAPIVDASELGADAFADAWQALPLSPDELEELGNVDFVSHRDELSERMQVVLGDVRVVRAPTAQRERSERWLPANPIAVLHIDGGIVSGSGGAVPLLGGFETGSGEISEACSAILADGRIRGVILRIDSPGGSATASEDIHRAISRLAEQLPIVVSLGDVAGSGGYYVASVGAPIVAAPTSLTGSIGVYAGTFALDGLLGRIGVSRQRVGIGQVNLFDGHHWSPEELEIVADYVDDIYEMFIGRVAESRELSRDEVDTVARGRIYSGEAALQADLVDSLGGFTQALSLLRSEADIANDAPISFVHYPQRPLSLASALPDIGLPSLGLAPGSSASNPVHEWLERLGLDAFAELLGTALSSQGDAMMMMDLGVQL